MQFNFLTACYQQFYLNQRTFKVNCLHMRTVFFAAAVWLLTMSTTRAQRIYYAEPDRDDTRQMKFEILGKFQQQYLIYKNNRNRHHVAVYDPNMQLKEKVELDFIPERTFNVEFFTYPDYSVLIYQYQRRSIVYCMGVKLDAQGHKIGEPLQIDTTDVGVFGDSKIYSIIASDDRQRIMVFKIKGRERDAMTVSTLLLNANLMPLRRSRFDYKLEGNRETIADFYLDNDGNFLFTHVGRPGQREYINALKLVVLPAFGDTLRSVPLQLSNVFLDEARIKVDNVNKRYIVLSYYSKTRRGNVDGLYTAIVNQSLEGTPIERANEFSDDFRNKAKGESSTKLAFNDYFLKHFIVKKDGGVLVTGEAVYTNQRNSMNRWDMMSPWLWGTPWGMPGFVPWSAWNNWGWSPWGWGGFGWGTWGMPGMRGATSTRYYADNVMVLSLDADANLQWSNVINKSQYDDETDNLLSYQIMNVGGELFFLYNEWQRRTPLLSAQSVKPDGKVDRQPPLKSLDRGYEFMIRFGKQVSAREMLVPCLYRNMICFARIEF